MKNGVPDAERSHFGDRFYGVTLASSPESMDLELEDFGPPPGRGLVMLASYDDDSAALAVRTFTNEPLPLELVEHFIGVARQQLPPPP